MLTEFDSFISVFRGLRTLAGVLRIIRIQDGVMTGLRVQQRLKNDLARKLQRFPLKKGLDQVIKMREVSEQKEVKLAEMATTR